MPPVFRFAPSPNGYLHLGHACSALLNAEYARRLGGRFLVRIEDIDTVRCRPELVTACLEDLEWLGLAWEMPVLRQSTRFEQYRAVATDLAARGLLYPCFCTRAELARAANGLLPRDPDGVPVYPGTCLHLPDAVRAQKIESCQSFALRLDMTKALAAIGRPLFWQEHSGALLESGVPVPVDAAAWGDVVLVRKEIPTSYHLAVVLDDALQGVTHVVRGKDLYAATAIHRVLQHLLGLAAPIYHHHDLITDANGQKLAKSAASKPLRVLRQEGSTAQDIRRQLGFAEF